MGTRAAMGSGNAESNAIVRDVMSELQRLDPDSASLAAFLMYAKKSIRVVDNPIYRLWEQADLPRSTQINNGAGYASNSTSIVVDDGGRFYVDQTLWVPRTDELMQITAIATNTLTVTRNVGEAGAAALVDNDTVIGIAVNRAEGGTVGNPNHVVYTNPFNHIAKLEHVFSETDIGGRSKFEYGAQYENRKEDAKAQHLKDIEHMLLWGQRGTQNGSGNTPTYHSRGLFYWITTNSYNAGGGLTEDAFEQSFLESAFRYSSRKAKGTKVGLAAARVISVMNSWGRDGWRTNDALSGTYGFAIKEYVSAHGTLIVARHKLLEVTHAGTPSDTQRLPSRSMVVFDPGNIRLAALAAGSKIGNQSMPLGTPHLFENLQQNNAYGRVGAYISYLGLDLSNEETHAELLGVTA